MNTSTDKPIPNHVTWPLVILCLVCFYPLGAYFFSVNVKHSQRTYTLKKAITSFAGVLFIAWAIYTGLFGLVGLSLTFTEQLGISTVLSIILVGAALCQSVFSGYAAYVCSTSVKAIKNVTYRLNTFYLPALKEQGGIPLSTISKVTRLSPEAVVQDINDLIYAQKLPNCKILTDADIDAMIKEKQAVADAQRQARLQAEAEKNKVTSTCPACSALVTMYKGKTTYCEYCGTMLIIPPAYLLR